MLSRSMRNSAWETLKLREISFRCWSVSVTVNGGDLIPRPLGHTPHYRLVQARVHTTGLVTSCLSLSLSSLSRLSPLPPPKPQVAAETLKLREIALRCWSVSVTENGGDLVQGLYSGPGFQVQVLKTL